MAKIYIHPMPSGSILEQEESLAQKLNTLSMDLSSIQRNLRYKIAAQGKISSHLTEAVSQVSKEKMAVDALREGFAEIIAQYNKAETANIEKLVANAVEQTTNVDQGVNEGSATEEKFFDWLIEKYEDFFGKDGDSWSPAELLKKYLTAREKIGGDSSAGLQKEFLSYIESLCDFLFGDKQGLSGAKDLCDLTSASSGLWNGLYKFFRNFDATRSSESIGLFAEKWGRTSAWVSLFGRGAGVFGAFMDAFDTEGKTNGEIAAGGVETIDDIAKLWQSIYDFNNYKNASNPALTAAGKYVVVAESAVSFISQAIKSTEKYSADGKYDMGDLGATGIDSSVAGLYTMTDSIIGFFTFGLFSLDQTGLSAEEISTNIKNYANEWGTRAGNLIVSNPSMAETYQSGNAIERTAITTFAIMSAQSKSQYAELMRRNTMLQQKAVLEGTSSLYYPGRLYSGYYAEDLK